LVLCFPIHQDKTVAAKQQVIPAAKYGWFFVSRFTKIKRLPQNSRLFLLPNTVGSLFPDSPR